MDWRMWKTFVKKERYFTVCDVQQKRSTVWKNLYTPNGNNVVVQKRKMKGINYCPWLATVRYQLWTRHMIKIFISWFDLSDPLSIVSWVKYFNSLKYAHSQQQILQLLFSAVSLHIKNSVNADIADLEIKSIIVVKEDGWIGKSTSAYLRLSEVRGLSFNGLQSLVILAKPSEWLSVFNPKKKQKISSYEWSPAYARPGGTPE